NTEAIVRSQALSPQDRALLHLPLHYCYGASVLHSHLWAGGSVVFDRRSLFIDRLIEAMLTHTCTTFAGVPFSYERLASSSALDRLSGSSLRRFLQAGGALAPEIIRATMTRVPQAAFYVMYGQTEATSRISTFEARAWPDKIGSAGRP